MQRPRRSIQPGRWPDAHKAAWARARAGLDMFDERTTAARWSAETWISVSFGYSRWLGHLQREGLLAEECSPASLVTPENVSGYIAHLRATVAAATVEICVSRLYSAMKAIAPDCDWTWLRDTAKHLRGFVKRVNKADKLVPAEELYRLGHRLMLQATTTSTRRSESRVLFRDGLMIAMLVARPLRRRNLARLRIGQQLVKFGDIWMLQVPANDTKGRRSIEAPLPTDLHGPLDTYLRTYRPGFLDARSHDWLWPSRKGGRLADQSIHLTVAKRTKTAFGRAICPHLFRASAATTIAIADPLNIRAATELLGHTRPWTTEKYYNYAQTIDASRRYQGHLDALRDRLGCSGIDAEDQLG